MTLETWYFIAQILAALAVVGSLLFVGVQLRAQAESDALVHRVPQHAAAKLETPVALRDQVVTQPIQLSFLQLVALAFHDLGQHRLREAAAEHGRVLEKPARCAIEPIDLRFLPLHR